MILSTSSPTLNRSCTTSSVSSEALATAAMLGFVAGPGLPLQGKVGAATRTCELGQKHRLDERSPRRSTCVMLAESVQKKKKASKTFALDEKGKPVWKLRTPTPADVEAVLALEGDVGLHGASILTGIFEEEDCSCAICEASVKGGKEGEGYRGEILGCALANINLRVKDIKVGFESGLIKDGEVLAITVSNVLPNADEIKRTLLLAALQKMKTNGVAQVTQSVPSDNEEEIGMFKSLGFKVIQNADPQVRGSKSRLTYLSAQLLAVNADPQKKFSS